ncbi:hypothetical protein [Pseudooceanicola sp. LIPI14-2-Ac024]|uniref:hypothetical protein n=1 Tax=Pseudooceanicola sp. LIPI14-2-Ac024 TaxID=3344875 RepID=UPI0035D07476
MLYLLQYLHILTGVIWAGGSVVFGLAVMPGIAAMPAAEAARALDRIARRAAPVMGASGVLVMVLGVARAWYGGGITTWGDWVTPYGLHVIAALVLVTIAEGSGGPSRARLKALTEDPEAFALNAPRIVRRDALVHVAVVVLVIAIMVSMGLGYY